MPPEITQEHVSAAYLAARRLSRTWYGQVVSLDEMKSHSLVVLWEIARAYDPNKDRNQDFTWYVKANLHYRMLDWLRSTSGRIRDGRMDARARVEWRTDYMGLENLWDDAFEDPEQTAEEALVAREEYSERLEAIFSAAKTVLTDRQYDALLADYHGHDRALLAEKWGMSVATLHVHATHARRRIRDHLGLNERAA